MKKLKTIVSLALAASMMASIAACSDDGKKKETNDDKTTQEETEATEETTEAAPSEAEETEETEAFSAPTGPKSNVDLINFCEDHGIIHDRYFDAEIEGNLDFYFATNEYSDYRYTDFYYNSCVYDGTIELHCNDYDENSVELVIRIFYSGSDSVIYSFSYISREDIENIIYNITDSDYPINGNTIGDYATINGEVNSEDVAKDVEALYARLIATSTTLFKQYDPEISLEDFGFIIDDKINSISTTERLACDKRNGMPEFGSESDDWFTSLASSIEYIAKAYGLGDDSYRPIYIPDSRHSNSFGDSVSLIYYGGNDAIELSLNSIYDDSALGSHYTLSFTFIKDSDDVDVHLTWYNKDSDEEPDDSSCVLSFTCPKNMLVTASNSADALTDFGVFISTNDNEESEVMDAFITSVNYALPIFNDALAYIGTSLAEGGF